MALISETPVGHYADLNIPQVPVYVPLDRELMLVEYGEIDVKSLQPRTTTESGNGSMPFTYLVLCTTANHFQNACNLQASPIHTACNLRSKPPPHC